MLTTFATFATLLHTGGECSPTRRGGYHPPVPLTCFLRRAAEVVSPYGPSVWSCPPCAKEGGCRRQTGGLSQNRAILDGRAMPVPTGDRCSRGRSRLPVPLTTFATFATLLHTGGECSPTRRGGYHPPVPLTCFFGGLPRSSALTVRRCDPALPAAVQTDGGSAILKRVFFKPVHFSTRPCQGGWMPKADGRIVSKTVRNLRGCSESPKCVILRSIYATKDLKNCGFTAFLKDSSPSTSLQRKIARFPRVPCSE